MTVPVITIAVPMSRCAMTSDHLRLTVSATTPAGTSQTSAIRPWATPITTRRNADKSASITRYRLATNQYPRWNTANTLFQRTYNAAISRLDTGTCYRATISMRRTNCQLGATE